VAGLDDVLAGGLPVDRLYLIEGVPGAGKTTLALQFLLDGATRGERGLYITLSETSEELRAAAQSHGWSLEGIDLFELADDEGALGPDREMTLLHPWEIELGETIKVIADEVARVRPTRVVIDTLSEMRLLAQDPLRYRRQILALKQFFNSRDATVILIDDRSTVESDLQLHSVCHGVIALDRLPLDYGPPRRRLEIQKMRGMRYREGWHDFTIRTGGLEVFPRIAVANRPAAFDAECVSSGIPALDALLHGGPLRGTSTLFTGPAGSGKTSLALQYIHAAAARGERSAVYEFDERVGTLLARAAALGSDIAPHVETGLIELRQINPAELSPGEFAVIVQREVESGTRMVVIDSFNGYLASMPQEKHLLLQVHELLAYLAHRRVATFIVNPQQGLVGGMKTSLNVSFIADTILLLRFFEAGGRVRKALSVIKNRGGSHEDTIRELRLGGRGVRVGEPLTAFHGVLTGTPTYLGEDEPLLAATATSVVGSQNAEPPA
jgi:circadian clock protein KaiC